MGCKQIIRSFFRDDSGQDLIEYALIATLIAVGAIASLTTGSVRSIHSLSH